MTEIPRQRAEPTSLTLLAKIRANEPDAWNRLMGLYRPLVFYWCSRWGVIRDDAEDILQEVFSAASENLDNFRKERPEDTFRGWLRGITRNKLLLHFRQRDRHPAASGGTDALRHLDQLEDPIDDEDAPEEISGLYRRALELVRGEFEERTWQMFWATVVESRAPTSVAEEMEVTPAAIRKAKSRVLRRLKEEVGDLVD